MDIVTFTLIAAAILFIIIIFYRIVLLQVQRKYRHKAVPFLYCDFLHHYWKEDEHWEMKISDGDIDEEIKIVSVFTNISERDIENKETPRIYIVLPGALISYPENLKDVSILFLKDFSLEGNPTLPVYKKMFQAIPNFAQTEAYMEILRNVPDVDIQTPKLVYIFNTLKSLTEEKKIEWQKSISELPVVIYNPYLMHFKNFIFRAYVKVYRYSFDIQMVEHNNKKIIILFVIYNNSTLTKKLILPDTESELIETTLTTLIDTITSAYDFEDNTHFSSSTITQELEDFQSGKLP